MRKTIAIIAVATEALGAAVYLWRRDPRIDSAFVNSVVNPWLLRRGLAGGRYSEIGPIEHIGRKSGIRWLTPVHPEHTPEGYRVMLPLGAQSEWGAQRHRRGGLPPPAARPDLRARRTSAHPRA